MAVSGLHLSVIVGSLYWLLRKLRLSAWLTTVLTGAVLLVYDGVAGFSASVVRASLMMAVLLAARLFGRKADGLNSLGLAVFLLCTECELAAVGDFRSVAVDFIPGAEQEPCSAAYSQIFAPKL